MAASLWKFAQRNKRYLLKLSVYPFAAGILVGSGLKDFFQGFLIFNSFKDERKEESHSLQHFQSSTQNEVVEKYGLPVGGPLILRYSNHTLQYDTAKKIPLWVLEHMTKDNLKGHAERNQCSFRPDRNVPKQFQSRNEDYLGSGFARGHMVPASDVKDSQEGMKETFLLTNIIPQDYDNNGGFWYRMENYCRSLTNKFSDVYVMSGPLFLSYSTEEKKFVKYQLIGENEIAVPSHLFKVIMVENKNKPVAMAAFIVPNAPITEKHVLKDFQVPLQKLEIYTGFKVFPNINQKQLCDLCVSHGCHMLSKTMADMNILRKNLKRAKSLDDLEKLWQIVQEKDIQLDKSFMDKYWEKRKLIERK